MLFSKKSKMIACLVSLLLCAAHVLGALSYITVCQRLNAGRDFLLTSCNGVSWTQHAVCVDVDFYEQSATSVVYTPWDELTYSSTTTSQTSIPAESFPFTPGQQYISLGPTCIVNSFATLGTSEFTLTTFYVTTFYPASAAAVTQTVTSSICNGSDGIQTRYTTGPVEGTSTITSCPTP